MNRLARAALVGTVALGAVPAVGLTPAFACDCVSTDDAGHLEHADVAFRGRLVQGAGEQTSSTGHFILAFRATRAYKGEVERDIELRTEQQGTACGLGLTEPGPYLVFANRPEEGRYETAGPDEPELFASSCGGTRLILPGEHPFGRGRPVAAGGHDGRDGRDGESRPAATAVLDVLRDLLGWLTPAVAHVLDAAERATAVAASSTGSR